MFELREKSKSNKCLKVRGEALGVRGILKASLLLLTILFKSLMFSSRRQVDCGYVNTLAPLHSCHKRVIIKGVLNLLN